MPNFSLEILHGRTSGKTVCGVDEVGRGPLAGPVMAAAVILPPKLPRGLASKIRDSKKMTASDREKIFEPLRACCLYAIAEASVAEIAHLNILWASLLAMRRAIADLKTPIDMALIDGNRVPHPLACQAVPVIGGDDQSLSVAAASIIAKVTRDRFMKQLATTHPGYGWERNAGYGTPEHLEALKRLGPTLWHRDSFAPVSQLKLLIK